VRGATPGRVVLGGSRGLLPDFLAAAEELVALGAEAITTNCGFLSISQREIAAAVQVPVAGAEGGREFLRVLIRAEATDLDVALAEADILDAGRALVAAHPEVGAVVLECTNMPPYAAALREAIDLPVYDVYSMIAWFQAGLRPRRF
jgi:Asp/Glu/hydantoin racemase